MLPAERRFTTMYPYCGVGCHIDLSIKDIHIIRADGWFDDQAHQGIVCLKGRFRFGFVQTPCQYTMPFKHQDSWIQGQLKAPSCNTTQMEVAYHL